MVKIVVVLLVLRLANGQLSTSEITLRPQPHYQKITLEKYLKDNGVGLEKHQIVTQDGYFLGLFHFYGEKRTLGHNNPRKTPVLLVHGMTADCSTWFDLKLGRTLPYMLLKNGNDVWCVNLRGTIPSRKHKRYKLYSQAFWDFSWHECGVYDLPPVIDYIRNYTKHDKLIGVGHSSGNTLFYVLLSFMPEYNNKIEHIFSLAPTVGAKHMRNPLLVFLAKLLSSLEFLRDIVYYVPIWPETLGKPCRSSQMMVFICTQLISLHFGYNPGQLNYKATTTLLSSSPTTISTKFVFHYIFTYNSGNFSEYDYGASSNLEIYGTPWPRNYNTSNVIVPITLMYGRGDLLTPPEEVKYANELFGNSKMFLVDCGNFNHLDFTWGKYTWRCVYEKIIDYINKGY